MATCGSLGLEPPAPPPPQLASVTVTSPAATEMTATIDRRLGPSILSLGGRIKLGRRGVLMT